MVTDFGADESFERAADKLREHYGISVPPTAVARITEGHAHALSEADLRPPTPTRVRPLTLIAEIDGSMIPVVNTTPDGATPGDRRKHRSVLWKEARLSLVRRPDQVEPIFAVTLGDAEQAGAARKQLAIAAGLQRQTQVHALGDGAPWIADQVEVQFGCQGRYLIDFYHLCDYLAAAAPSGPATQAGLWMAEQKTRFKTGQTEATMADLAVRSEPKTIPAEQAPVRQCLRYVLNRPGQFNYPQALAAKLPIGSGEVESAHRYVVQKRLKLPGAWWVVDNAAAMLNLRTLRANHLWQRYWDRLATA